jgi:lipopolysaccharide/colanic/teichoic acid biosynthesis glycosyltransferase
MSQANEGRHVQVLAADGSRQDAAAEGCRDAAAVLALVAAHPELTVLAPAEWFPVLTGPGGVRPVRREGASWICFPAARPARAGWGERLVAAGLFLLALPAVALAAGVIRMLDGGPAFFVQARAGRDGRGFHLWKLRTMRAGAEAQRPDLARVVPAGRPLKDAADPRVTRLGRWLRAHGLDELPQLLHVVLGTMRLVGPRPLPVYEDGYYTAAWHRARLDGRPGLTGLWQVAVRNVRTFEEMCLLDIWYLRNRSLRLDLWIVWRTLGVIWRG